MTFFVAIAFAAILASLGSALYFMMRRGANVADERAKARGMARALAFRVGFSIVLFSAALSSVPDALYEFARLEGAGVVQQEMKITLPMILPTAFLVFVMAWVNAFKIFKEVYFIGGAYPRDAVYTLQHYMNNQFAKLDYQNVTTAAYSFALIVFVLFGMLYLSRGVRGNDR